MRSKTASLTRSHTHKFPGPRTGTKRKRSSIVRPCSAPKRGCSCPSRACCLYRRP
ncbi:hypothetical protein BJV77DRAFT_984754 [Russula vinacea]|nr:hypothetical protein BJV77DRAFT_984754 [Russula vinacea]